MALECVARILQIKPFAKTASIHDFPDFKMPLTRHEAAYEDYCRDQRDYGTNTLEPSHDSATCRANLEVAIENDSAAEVVKLSNDLLAESTSSSENVKFEGGYLPKCLQQMTRTAYTVLKSPT